MKITSRAFENGEFIPKKYTADGENLSPPLSISEVPEGTRSFALIVDDPDAPVGTWVHWVVWNISANTKEIPEGAGRANSLGMLGIDGNNDFRVPGYGGPAPPPGPSHTYCFKLYALDHNLNLPAGSTKADLEKAMRGCILAKAELAGEYQRQ
ncbi:YbhB/YbcL family Raf kinase inhibitor-like protein [Candidatus Micrarchaeota archaeon]|nr:YbhB/YbcL family Raf kinase inhibitor-like protein [Candidatus Micrarchaeota archaeon]